MPERSGQLVIIASPQYVHTSRAYLAAVADLQKVAKRYGCEVYDYADYYIDSPDMFKDASHLNHKGAVDFTERVIEKHLYTREPTPNRVQ